MDDNKKRIVDLLKTRSILKQNVFSNTKDWFKVFKEELNSCIQMIQTEIGDDRVRLKIVDISESEIQLFIGSDVLIFHMHTNVFKFDSSNFVHKSSYVKNNPNNAYCGVVNIYNFLADSYEKNRYNDYGYLIGRVFINQESHFLVEGKGRLGFIYRDFLNQIINNEIILDIIMRVAVYAIEFDLLTPPYERVSVVSVQEMQTISNDSRLKTGKRLGFKFQADTSIS